MPTPSSLELSPRDLARAVGVSESSIKRWVDEGRLVAGRTAGGHRRIPLDAALRFVREAELDVVHPEVLGLRWLPPTGKGAEIGESLDDLLLAGRAEAFRGALVSAWLAGQPVASLCDGPLSAALRAVGERWRQDRQGVFEEHRASAIAAAGLEQLALFLRVSPDAPVAVGGAISGDTCRISSLMARATLADAGWRAIDLGADTPARAIADALRHHRPRLVWLSASHVTDKARQRKELRRIHETCVEAKLPLIVGGPAIGELVPRRPRKVRVGSSFTDLATFAAGLANSP